MRKKRFRTLLRDIHMDAVIEAGEMLQKHGMMPDWLKYTLDKSCLDYETDKALENINDSYRNRLFLLNLPDD